MGVMFPLKTLPIYSKYIFTHLSSALTASWSPLASPLWIMAVFRTSCRAVFMSIPPVFAAAVESLGEIDQVKTNSKRWVEHGNNTDLIFITDLHGLISNTPYS